VTVASGWALCMAVLYAVVFGAYDLVQFDHGYDPVEATLYGSLHRPAWAIAVAWIIFACHSGYGGIPKLPFGYKVKRINSFDSKVK
jgi:hypothetical protein